MLCCWRYFKKTKDLSWFCLWAVTCVFMSLCKIFLSWICFSPREICTNQLRICRGNMKQNWWGVWRSLKCLHDNIQEERNNILVCVVIWMKLIGIPSYRTIFFLQLETWRCEKAIQTCWYEKEHRTQRKINRTKKEREASHDLLFS